MFAAVTVSLFSSHHQSIQILNDAASRIRPTPAATLDDQVVHEKPTTPNLERLAFDRISTSVFTHFPRVPTLRNHHIQNSKPFSPPPSPPISSAMIPPKAEYVHEVERGRPPATTCSTPGMISHTFTAPATPDTTYFASILKREREAGLPVYEFEKERPTSTGSQKSFDMRSYREDLAVKAKRRRRKYDCIAALVVAFVLLGCVGTLAAVMVST